MTPLLPPLVPSTIAEHRRTFRHSLMAADREERWQAGMLTEPRVIGSGSVVALEPSPMRLFVGSQPSLVISKVGIDAYRRYFGMLVSWRDGKLPDQAIAHGVPWAMDNYAFIKWDAVRFEAMLVKCRPFAASCQWVVAPDVPRDAVATLARFWEWHAIIRSYGYKVAYAAQNGIERTSIPWQAIDCLFVGGDDTFKANCAPLVREAKARGKLTHMGRVNSKPRLRLSAAYGFDSCDGSSYASQPNKIINERHLATLFEVNTRIPLLEVA